MGLANKYNLRRFDLDRDLSEVQEIIRRHRSLSGQQRDHVVALVQRMRVRSQLGLYDCMAWDDFAAVVEPKDN